LVVLTVLTTIGVSVTGAVPVEVVVEATVTVAW